MAFFVLQHSFGLLAPCANRFYFSFGHLPQIVFIRDALIHVAPLALWARAMGFAGGVREQTLDEGAKSAPLGIMGPIPALIIPWGRISPSLFSSSRLENIWNLKQTVFAGKLALMHP